MSNLSGLGQISGQEVYTDSASQIHELGELRVDRQGRKFRYCQVGATALVAGSLYQAAAQAANHQDLTVVSGAAGSKQIVATLGNTLASVNQYAGGWVVITVTPGVGYCYKISGHAAVAALGDITLALDDVVQVALTTTSRVDLIPNPYRNVILSIGGTNTGKIVGVANDIVTNAQWGWLQTGGACCVLNDAGTVVVGDQISASNATAGAVESGVAAQPSIGHALAGIAANEHGAVWLMID